jgi:flagellar biosynthesis protein FlhB
VLFVLAFILSCFTVSILSKQKSKTVSPWYVSKNLAADALQWVAPLMVPVTLGGLTMSLIAEIRLFVRKALAKMLQKISNATLLCVLHITSKTLP